MRICLHRILSATRRVRLEDHEAHITRTMSRMRSQTAGSNLPLDAPERRRLPLLLRRAWEGLNQAFRRRLAPLKLTPDQFTVMRTRLEHDGVTQRQLTELMTSDPNTVASLLERMERAGLVARQAHEKDRRARRLALQPLDVRKHKEAREGAIALQAEVLRTLHTVARARLLADLDA